MRKVVLILCAIMFCETIKAETDSLATTAGKEPEKMQTLFNNTGKLGWWISPDFAWSQINNDDAFLFGVSAGVIVKHSFSFGLAGYGVMNSQSLRYSGINDTADVFLYGGYGGFKMEYRLMPLQMVNIAFPLLIGGGGISYSTWNPYDWHNTNNNYDEVHAYAWDTYFVLEPGVVVGINLLKFMRLDIGASYRYAPGVELPRTDSNIMSSFNFVSSLKFGSF